MTIEEYANLPENKSGFWVEKTISPYSFYPYRVYHNGFTTIAMTISEAKQKLHERSEKLLRDRQAKRAIDSIEKLSATIPVSRSVKLIDISALITKQ